jgi:hypothetical protein
MIKGWLQRGLLGLIIGVSLYASVKNLIASRDLGSLTYDPVANFVDRFGPLKARLPFLRGVVGYISDSAVQGIVYDPANDQGEYVLVQYAMAPIIIVRGTSQEWNVALLTSQAYKAWSQSNTGQFEVIPFKYNLYLIHRLKK